MKMLYSKGLIKNGIKLLVLITSPLQQLIDHPCLTHQYCNIKAIDFLSEKGFNSEANFFLQYLPEIQTGAAWADINWKNINHFFNPVTERGLYGFNSAVYDFSNYLNKVIENLKNNEISDSMFYLGAASHLLQDMCVPHHVNGQLFNGHKKYELWVQNNLNLINVKRDFKELSCILPCNLFVKNAKTALEMKNYTQEFSNIQDFKYSTDLLFSLSCLSTTDLFYWFLCQIKSKMDIKISKTT